MGKVIITAQMSTDASIGPELGWFAGGEHEAAGEDELRLADALVLGRRTYEALAPIWLQREGAFADQVNNMPKYVASTTLTEVNPLAWNAALITGDFAQEVRFLKEHHAGNLLSYGCGELAFNLVKLGLADELHFWVHPVIWSESRRPFYGLGHVRMHLRSSTVFRNGVTLQHFDELSVEE